MTIADKLTLLASSKEALRVKLGLPESLPLSEYVNYLPEWSPKYLFRGGKQGVWYDPSDKSTLFQDVAGTIPVTKDGDPIGLMKDKSGNGYHATQSISAARPLYKTDGVLSWFDTDGMDDWFETNYTPSADWSSGIGIAVHKLGGFVFESYEGAANNYLGSSAQSIAIFSPPSGTNLNTKYFEFGVPFTYLSQVSGDNIGTVPLAIGARNTGAGLRNPVKVSLFGLIITNFIMSEEQVGSVDKYLATKSGVTL